MTLTASRPPGNLPLQTSSSDSPKRGWFWRLGAWSARWRWLVVAAWLLVLAGVTIGSSPLNGSYNATFNLPNSSAQIGADLLQAHTGHSTAVSSGAATGNVVFHAASAPP